MQSHDDKAQKTPKRNQETQSGKQQNQTSSTSQFADQRQEAVAQGKLQGLINDSPRFNRMAQMKDIADTGVSNKQAPFSRQPNPAQAQVAQAKFTIGGQVFTKKGAKVTLELVKHLRNNYDAGNWTAGWVGYLKNWAADPMEKIPPFPTMLNFVEYMQGLYPPKAPKVDSSPAAELLISAFKDAGPLSIAGFIWKTVSQGFTLNDGRTFSKIDLIQGLRTTEGRQMVDAAWRDKSGTKRVDQKIQGQHEWILTSDLVYVIDNARNIDDLAIWFMAAEILRTPTKNVIFNVHLEEEQMEMIRSGQVETFAELGVLNAHAGGIFRERDDDDEKKEKDSKYNVQVAGGSTTFHHDLHRVLLKHLNSHTSDIRGFLAEVMEFQKQKTWSGEIEGMGDSMEIGELETGFYTGAKKGSPAVSSDMSGFMLLQQQRVENDLKIMENRVNAIFSEIDRLQNAKNSWFYRLHALGDEGSLEVEAIWEDLEAKNKALLEHEKKIHEIVMAKQVDAEKARQYELIFQHNVQQELEKLWQNKMEVLNSYYDAFVENG